jgi:diguanylate cyclase (GGDEF)-like protein
MNSSKLFAAIDPGGLDEILDMTGDAVCVSDKNMVFVAANQKFASFYGHSSPSEVLGLSAFDVYPGFDRSVFYEACAHTFATGEPTSRVGYSANTKSWLAMRFCEIGPDRYAMMIHNMVGPPGATGAAALVDELTSLANRSAFDRDSMAIAQYSHQTLAILDISHFKQFNEIFGFEAGDRCLMKTASRLKQGLRSSDRLYRIGNDQFLVLATSPLEHLRSLLLSVKDQLETPMEFDGKMCVIHFNIGIAHAEGDAAPGSLLKKAEHALSRAKFRKTGWEEYRPGADFPSFDPFQLKLIHDALNHDQMVVFLQPQIDLIDGGVIGAEALVRWNHPDRGLLAPADFLPLIEEAGLAAQLDAVVLSASLGILDDWVARGLSLKLSVNLSPQSMGTMKTVETMAAQLRGREGHASQLCVEITEGALIQDVETSCAVVEGLRALGVEVALDDFGSGYCSMAYLLRYPSHFLKIDRLFISNLCTSSPEKVMVRNIIALAHGLGIGVVAEGVETAEQASLLREMGCDMAQGYFYARPLSSAAFDQWLSTQRPGSLESSIR